MRGLIKSEADLQRLMRPESALHPFRKPPVVIDIAELTRAETAAWELRLEALRQSCGCTSGAVFLGILALASLAYVLASAVRPGFSLPGKDENFWDDGAIFLLGLIISAALGKLVGLSFAAVRFRHTCRALQERVRAVANAPECCC